MAPRVTIVMPTYNRGALLPQALDGALAQTYPDLELIVVDDGSTDDTREVLAAYGDRLRWFSQENRGCGGAKNLGLRHARGEYITNLDDDDILMPDKVARQVAWMDTHPEAGICATGGVFVESDGRTSGSYIPPRLERHNQSLTLLRGCPFIQSSVMVRRDCHERLGEYKEVRFGEDYDFWLRVSLHYDLGVLEEPLTIYRRHAGQITRPDANRRNQQIQERFLQEFLRSAEPTAICPAAPDEATARLAIAAVLAGRKYFTLAQEVLAPLAQKPAGRFWQGVIALRRKEFATAEERLAAVPESSPWGPQARRALDIVARGAAAAQRRKEALFDDGLQGECRTFLHRTEEAAVAAAGGL